MAHTLFGEMNKKTKGLLNKMMQIWILQKLQNGFRAKQ